MSIILTKGLIGIKMKLNMASLLNLLLGLLLCLDGYIRGPIL